MAPLVVWGASPRLAFEPAVNKVFLDEQPPAGAPSWRVEMARGDRESFQLLITAGSDLKDVRVENAFSAKGLEAEVSVVGYVRTGERDRRPWAKTEKVGKIGWWPDPLLPNRPFDVARGETQPVWVTVGALPGTRAGEYKGTLRVRWAGGKPRAVSYRVRVWDVDLPRRRELRNAAFMSPQSLHAHYRPAGGIDGQEFFAIYKRWVEKAFSLHLGPTLDMLMGWVQKGKPAASEEASGRAAHLSWPVRWKDGRYDFARVDELVEIGRPYGMRQFGIAIFDRREAWEDHTATMKREMAEYLRAYAEHLRARGMLQEAYVYNADEPPAKLWDTVRKNHEFVKATVPDLKTWLCLNEPGGVKALEGFTDIWDVYIRQYEKSGVRARQEAGDQVIWAVCVWPHEHPNLFIEYPAMDARMIGWLTYVYGTAGLEYWSLNSWGPNQGSHDWANFERGDSRTAFQPTRWPWGDGWLLYPGRGGEPLSSVRFENLRDGFEDAELLLALDKAGRREEAQRIAKMAAPSIDGYASRYAQVESARRSLLEALAGARKASAGGR
jgi:hypothetical protein